LVDVKSRAWVQSFSHENVLKFSEKVGIFPKIHVFQKKIFTFYAGLLMHRLIELSPWCMPSAPRNPPLIKKGRLIGVISSPPFLNFFSADTLDYMENENVYKLVLFLGMQGISTRSMQTYS